MPLKQALMPARSANSARRICYASPNTGGCRMCGQAGPVFSEATDSSVPNLVLVVGTVSVPITARILVVPFKPDVLISLIQLPIQMVILEATHLPIR